MQSFSDKGKLILVGVVLVLFLVFVGVFYLKNQGDVGQRTPIVGDPVCGGLDGDEAQSKCCALAHGRDVVIDCLGDWKYNKATKLCSFVCDNAQVFCTEDAKLCDDGTSVSRNASLGCEFNACPQDNATSYCTETDEGNNIYEKGDLRAVTSYGYSVEQTDQCRNNVGRGDGAGYVSAINGTDLLEWACELAPQYSRVVVCDNGCINGACVQ